MHMLQSGWTHTGWLSALSQAWCSALGHMENIPDYSRLGYPTLPKAVSLGTVVFYPSLIFFSFFFFSSIFRMDSNLIFSSIAYILLLLPYTINRYQIILIKYHEHLWRLSRWQNGKESACQCRRCRRAQGDTLEEVMGTDSSIFAW